MTNTQINVLIVFKKEVLFRGRKQRASTRVKDLALDAADIG